MGKKLSAENEENSKLAEDFKKGYFFMFLFVIFIAGGIITKRVFNHPEWMMVWHLPAAIFLIIGGKKLTKEQRKQYFQNKFKITNLN